MGRGRRRHNESTFRRGRIGGNTRYGVSQTVEQLRELGEHVIEAAKLALAWGADQVVADAKSRCPVKTGELRDSIDAITLKKGAEYKISADATNAKGIAYRQFVEFSPKIDKPFLYPAMDANRDIIYNDVKDAIKEAIDRGH